MTNRGKTEFRKLFCEYCKRPSHTKDKCFRLHGFQNNHIRNRDKKFAALVQARNFEVYSSSQTTRKTQFPELTSSQCKQLMEFLNGIRTLQNSEPEKTVGNANLAFSVKILDSGASDHMCHATNIFEFLQPLSKFFQITLPNGHKIFVT